MSSSSSEAEGVHALLLRSLDAIKADVPTQYAALCGALGGESVHLQIDHEFLLVQSDGRHVDVSAPAKKNRREPEDGQHVGVQLRTRARVIRDIIDGDCDLVDAVVSEAVELVGDIGVLSQFNTALTAYLHGAVRSPRFDAIVEEFRQLARQRSNQRQEVHHV